MKDPQLVQKINRTRLVFQIQGNLNHADHPLLDDLLIRTRGGPVTVYLDLSGLPALDLRGLTWLLSLERQFHSRGQRLKILKTSRQVKSILRLVHPAVRPLGRVRL